MDVAKCQSLELSGPTESPYALNSVLSAPESGECSIILLGVHANVLGDQLATAKNWTFLEEASILSLENKTHRKIATISPTVESDTRKAFLDNWMCSRGLVIHVIHSLNDDRNVFMELEESSNYTFFFDGDIESERDLKMAGARLNHLVTYANGSLFASVMPSLEHRSYFLTLLVPDVTPILADLRHMVSGTHAVELRIDLMLPSDPKLLDIGRCQRFIARQVGLVRKVLDDHPIIFTIRTISEGGHVCPSKITHSVLRDLFYYAVCLGCEFIDLEIDLHPEILEEVTLAARNKSRIIASHHSLRQPLDWTEDAEKHLDMGQQFGDVVKLVSIAESDVSNAKVQKFSDEYYSKNPKIPLIAFNLGMLGRPSRVYNRFFTPVTHLSLPESCRSPVLAQISVKEIVEILAAKKVLPPKAFYIFGENISYSLSPVIHNANFAYFNLPYNYSILDSSDFGEIERTVKSESFGGGSVTIPHKQAIMPMLDLLSNVAETIGAVNTIVVKPNGDLHGENTDWLGIHHCLKRALDMPPGRCAKSSALLIGAGGTAKAALYALNCFGFKKIYLYNRTEAKLEELTKGYPQEEDRTVLEIYKGKESFVKIGCPLVTIVDTTPAQSGMCPNRFVNEVLSDRNSSAVLVKLAYGNMAPEDEDLKPWISVVSGLDILIEQAIWAAELWTGLKPDAEHIKDAVGKYIESKNATKAAKST